jgi:hypothetical protein
MLSDIEAPPSRGNISVRKRIPDFLISGLLTFFAYLSPFSSNLFDFDSFATEVPPEEKILPFKSTARLPISGLLRLFT